MTMFTFVSFERCQNGLSSIYQKSAGMEVLSM